VRARRRLPPCTRSSFCLGKRNQNRAPGFSAPTFGRGSFRCSQAQARPKLTPLASLVPFKQLGGVRWVAGWRPRLGLLCCSALQDGAIAKQPTAGKRRGDRSTGLLGCWLLAVRIGCFRHLHPAEAHSNPGACVSKHQQLAPTHCLSGVSAANAASLSRSPGCEHCREPRRGGVSGGALFPPFGKTKGGPGAGRKAPAGSHSKHQTSAESAS
jgi:hypothetical protein